MPVAIFRAVTEADFQAARELMGEYVLTPGVPVCAVGFQQELDALESFYAGILLARDGVRMVGCGAFRILEPGIGEIKRLYVRPEARGLGAGRLLTAGLLELASGCRAVRLDTLPSMQAAIRLYESLGFRRIPPYSPSNPPEAHCYELGMPAEQPPHRL